MERCYTCQEVADRYGVKLITVWDWIRPQDIEAFESARRTIQP